MRQSIILAIIFTVSAIAIAIFALYESVISGDSNNSFQELLKEMGEECTQ